MNTAFFVTMTFVKVIIVIVGSALMVIDIIKVATGKKSTGYSKAIKIFLFMLGGVSLLTILEFFVAFLK